MNIEEYITDTRKAVNEINTVKSDEYSNYPIVINKQAMEKTFDVLRKMSKLLGNKNDFLKKAIILPCNDTSFDIHFRSPEYFSLLINVDINDGISLSGNIYSRIDGDLILMELENDSDYKTLMNWILRVIN